MASGCMLGIYQAFAMNSLWLSILTKATGKLRGQPLAHVQHRHWFQPQAVSLTTWLVFDSSRTFRVIPSTMHKCKEERVLNSWLNQMTGSKWSKQSSQATDPRLPRSAQGKSEALGFSQVKGNLSRRLSCNQNRYNRWQTLQQVNWFHSGHQCYFRLIWIKKNFTFQSVRILIKLEF